METYRITLARVWEQRQKFRFVNVSREFLYQDVSFLYANFLKKFLPEGPIWHFSYGLWSEGESITSYLLRWEGGELL